MGYEDNFYNNFQKDENSKCLFKARGDLDNGIFRTVGQINKIYNSSEINYILRNKKRKESYVILDGLTESDYEFIEDALKREKNSADRLKENYYKFLRRLLAYKNKYGSIVNIEDSVNFLIGYSPRDIYMYSQKFFLEDIYTESEYDFIVSYKLFNLFTDILVLNHFFDKNMVKDNWNSLEIKVERTSLKDREKKVDNMKTITREDMQYILLLIFLLGLFVISTYLISNINYDF